MSMGEFLEDMRLMCTFLKHICIFWSLFLSIIWAFARFGNASLSSQAQHAAAYVCNQAFTGSWISRNHVS